MEENALLRLTTRAAIISGAFCLVVSLLLLFNYLQFTAVDPLESQSMEVLLERLADDPANETLKNEIRQLDLLARKAFFNSHWQIRTGSYLLLFGAIVLLISLRYHYSLKARIPEPEAETRAIFKGGILTQRWLLGSGMLLIILALGAAWLTSNELDKYNTLAGTATPAETTTENIEVIDLSSPVPEPDETQASPEEAADAAAGDAAEGPASEAQLATGTDPGQAGETDDAGSPAETPAVSDAAVVTAGSARRLSREDVLSNHNSFRGPWGNGISRHQNIPVDWDGAGGRNVVWKKEVPKEGYNSPVIWKDMLFITGADEASQVIYCFDRHTGELKWQAETGDIPGSPATTPDVTEDTGLAAPSVAVDGSRVFAIFATGDIVCYTLSGERLWARNLGVPDNHYGHSSSLLVWQGKVFVQYDTNRGGRVLALDVDSGETAWDTRRDTGISWASPLLIEHNDRFQLILSADPLVAAYDLDSGEENWSVNCMMGEVGPSPAYGSGLIYAANEYAILVAIDPDDPENIVWENDEYLPEVASPVISEGLLFIATSYGVMACYDALSGEKYWEQEFGNGFYASPVVAEGKVYAIDMGGVMHVIKVDPQYQELGSPALGERAFATPAFAEGRIYLRGADHLFCIGN